MIINFDWEKFKQGWTPVSTIDPGEVITQLTKFDVTITDDKTPQYGGVLRGVPKIFHADHIRLKPPIRYVAINMQEVVFETEAQVQGYINSFVNIPFTVAKAAFENGTDKAPTAILPIEETVFTLPSAKG